MSSFQPIPAATEMTGRAILDAAFGVRRQLGVGLLESAYRRCMVTELRPRGHEVEQEVPVPFEHKGERLQIGFRMDILVNDVVVVELKAVEALHVVHEHQLVTYLRMSGRRLGFLINMNEPALREGIHRRVV